MVAANPFANLPVAKSIAKRERVLSDHEIAGDLDSRQQGCSALQSDHSPVDPNRPTPRRSGGHNLGRVVGRYLDLDDAGRAKDGAVHMVPLSGPARDLLRALLPDMPARRSAIAERITAAALALPRAVGTPFAGWSKSKRALDTAITEARSKAAASGTIVAPLVPRSVHDL